MRNSTDNDTHISVTSQNYVIRGKNNSTDKRKERNVTYKINYILLE